MRLLLDTHTFLWFIAGDTSLSARARQLIEDVSNERLLSIASLWKIGIKVSTGKLTLTVPMAQLIPAELQDNKIGLPPIMVEHAIHVSTLPYHHRDPLDRMLAAQSLVEQVPLVSVDAVFDSYGVPRLW